MEVIVEWFKGFWKRHIIDEIPPEHIGCARGRCDNCEFFRRFIYENSVNRN